MADVTMLDLPVAVSLDGSEDVWIVQGGTDKRTTTADIAATATGFVPTNRAINTPASGGLAGGGPLSGDLTLTFYPFGLTAKSAMAVADSFAINDVAGGDEPKKTTFPNAMKALTGLTALPIPDLVNDYLIINRASDGGTYKVNPSALGLAAGNVPAGGLTAQVLAKASNTDYDTEWVAASITLDALSLAGNPTGATALGVSVSLGATLAFSGSALQTGAATGDVTWSANSFSTTIANNAVTDAKFRQSAALSVVGNATNALANVADIAAASDHQVMRRLGTALAFGSIDLSQANTVGTSVLGPTNGGTGLATYTLGDTLYASASNTLSALAGNTTTAKQYLSQTGDGALSAAPAWAAVAGSDITGAALTKGDDTNVTLTLGGTPSTALLRAASITAGWTGTLAVARGGSGAGTFTTNGVLYGNGTSAFGVTGQGDANSVLTANAGAPAFSDSPTVANITVNTAINAGSATTTLGTVAGTVDMGGATSLEIPNGAAPTVNADGEIAVDTTVADFSHGILLYYSGEEMGVVAMPIAEFTTPSNGAVPTYNSTTDEFEMTVPAGGGDVTGPASSTVDDFATFSDTSGKVIKDSGLIRATVAQVRDPSVDSKIPTVKDLYDGAAEVALTSTSNSVAWDMDTGINFVISSLAENTTIANATNTVDGKTGRLRITNDGSARTVAWGTSYEFAFGTAPTASGANDTDIYYYDVVSSTRIMISQLKDVS